MHDATAPRDRRPVRRDYEETDDSVAVILGRHGISLSTLYDWARRDGWRMRSSRPRATAPKRKAGHGRPPAGMAGSARRRRVRGAALLDRLYRILEREVAVIERCHGREATGEGDGNGSRAAPADRERRLRSLNSIMRTLDKLMQVEGRVGAGPGMGTRERDDLSEADADRLRRDIARRLARLGEGGTA